MKRNILTVLFSVFMMSLPLTLWAQECKKDCNKNCKKNSVVRISCVGASITEGYGTKDPKTDSYPGALERLLGNGYVVGNYGRAGCTMLTKGDLPYVKYEKYKPSLESNPDIVFIDLGGNDAKLHNRIHKADFVDDACNLINTYRNLPSKPRVILMTAIPGFTSDSTAIWDKAIVRDINPLIIEAGRKAKVEVLDMHPILVGRSDLAPDDIHPNNEGAMMIAQKMADYLRKYPVKPSKKMTIDGTTLKEYQHNHCQKTGK